MRYANTLFTMMGFFGAMLSVGAVSAQGVQVGDLAPEFSCMDEQGKIWNSRDHVGKHIVVLYFYPGNFSRCCTQQAENFRDRHAELADQCAVVMGVSGDVVLTHKLFKDTYQLKQALLADSDGNIAKIFGVPLRSGDGGKAMVKNAKGEQVFDEKGTAISIPRPVTAERWTFIIGADGRVIYRDTAAAPKTDAQEVLTFLRNPPSKSQNVVKFPETKKGS